MRIQNAMRRQGQTDSIIELAIKHILVVTDRSREKKEEEQK